MLLVIFLILLFGVLCGLINVGLIIYIKVNLLVIMFGMLYLFVGSVLLFFGMVGVMGYEGIGGFLMVFIDFVNLDVLGFFVLLIIFLICFFVFWFWLYKIYVGCNVF